MPPDRAHRQSQRTNELSTDDRQLAEQLQRLSVEDAERVLERAIAFQTQLESGPHPDKTLDRAALERMAAELDISPEHLERAIVEEIYQLDAEDPSWFDRLIVPKIQRVHGVAPMSAHEARAVLDVWMDRHEGLRKHSERGGVTKWLPNNSLAASARRALRMSQGSGRLRRSDGIVTQIRPATENQTVLVAEADMRVERVLAGTALAFAGTLAVAGAGAIVSGALGSNGAEVAVGAAALGGTGLALTGAMIGLRMWAQRVKDSMRSAIDAITSSTVKSERESGGVGEFVSEWTGLVSDVRGELKKKRQRPR